MVCSSRLRAAAALVRSAPRGGSPATTVQRLLPRRHPHTPRLSYRETKSGIIVSDYPEKDGYFDHCADALRYGVLGWLTLSDQPLPSPRVIINRGR
jgi:hypothetical protein